MGYLSHKSADTVGATTKQDLYQALYSMGAKFDIKIGTTHVDFMQTKILLEELDCDFV